MSGTENAVGAPRDPEAVSRFTERFAAEMTEAGMQRAAARVFAALTASDDASMTSAELSERLSISPAAVSGAVRYLIQVNMISRERDPGTRRDRYRLYPDIWYGTFTARDRIMHRWATVLRDGADTLGRDTPAGERMAESVAFFEFVQEELLAMMDRWKVRQDELRARAAKTEVRARTEAHAGTEAPAETNGKANEEAGAGADRR